MSPLAGARPARVLLVEDNEADVRLTREALREAGENVRLSSVADGDLALAYLRREGGYADVPRPDLVLLDLNLPGMDGREVLEAIKGDRSLRQIPVVVLTTSSEERDVVRAYDAHVNAYVTKPLSFEEFIEAVRSIENFWLRLVKFPPHVSPS